MMGRSLIDRVFQQEHVNFVVTNRIPRRVLTRLMGWFSRIEQPVVRDASIGVWKLFAGDLQLHEAKKTHFTSLHDCFIRELKDGARPIDRSPEVLVSPCDGIVVACGRMRDGELLQAKGFTYSLDDLVTDASVADRYRHGIYATLRLTASMYHRFHAPADCSVTGVTYVPGDAWNVNPIALRRVDRLYCRNERAIVPATLNDSSESIVLVAVGAILVGSIRLHCLDAPLNRQYRGPHRLACQASFRKGEEIGYFHHGSTIIVLGTSGLRLAEAVREGVRLHVGEPLLDHHERVNGARPKR